MDKKNKKEIMYKVKELRKIINSWNFIPGAPSDEFDSLNHQLISHLYKGADIKKLTRIVHSELKTTYGLYSDVNDAETLAKEVEAWWVNYNN